MQQFRKNSTDLYFDFVNMDRSARIPFRNAVADLSLDHHPLHDKASLSHVIALPFRAPFVSPSDLSDKLHVCFECVCVCCYCLISVLFDGVSGSQEAANRPFNIKSFDRLKNCLLGGCYFYFSTLSFV